MFGVRNTLRTKYTYPKRRREQIPFRAVVFALPLSLSLSYLSSNHRRTTWTRRGRSESPDRNSRVRCSPVDIAAPPCPSGCSLLLSNPFCRCTCPPRRNRGLSRSGADSRPPRSTFPCSPAHSCICRWCSGRGRCSRALRTRRVAGSTPCPSSRDCIGTRRLCTRLNRNDGVIIGISNVVFNTVLHDIIYVVIDKLSIPFCLFFGLEW